MANLMPAHLICLGPHTLLNLLYKEGCERLKFIIYCPAIRSRASDFKSPTFSATFPIPLNSTTCQTMNRDLWVSPFDSKLDSNLFNSSRTESRIESKFESRIESLLDDHRQRLRLPWTNHNSIFDDHMFDFGNQIAAMQREIEETFRRFQNHEFSSTTSLKPLSLTNFSNLNSSSHNNSLSLTPYIEAHTDLDGRETGKYTMNIPIGGIISPEDLRISLKDHVMTIEAKKERQEGNSKTYQEFHRKFTLPPSVDPRDVKSVLSPEGTLKIEAPLPRRAVEAPRTSSQLIPIHREY